MQIKDSSVRTKLHPVLTDFLLTSLDRYYINIGGSLILTSGSEAEAHHSYTSLHYAGCAVDIRNWPIYSPDLGEVSGDRQFSNITSLAVDYCRANDIPVDWLEIILESDHIHIEYQPKREES